MRKTALISILYALASLVLGACGDGMPDSPVPGSAADTVSGFDVSPGGPADGAAVVVEAALGRTYAGHLEPFTSSAPRTLANMDGHMAILRLRLAEAATFAVILRRTSGDYDPYLILRDTGELSVSHDDQAVLPMAGETDSVIVLDGVAGGDYIIFGSDKELRGSGDYRIDLVALDVPTPDLGVTNPSLRALTDVLREDEVMLARYSSIGVVLEELTGTISVDTAQLSTIPLMERAALNGFVASHNDTRTMLFEQLLRAHDFAVSTENVQLVGRSVAQLWWAARAP